MTSHRQDPPSGMSLRWLNYMMRTLSWLTAFLTVASIIVYVGQQLFADYYKPSLVNMLLAVCAMMTFGGIVALLFMGVTKMTELWAEIIDGGSMKTALLEALLTDPIDQSVELKEE